MSRFTARVPFPDTVHEVADQRWPASVDSQAHSALDGVVPSGAAQTKIDWAQTPRRETTPTELRIAPQFESSGQPQPVPQGRLLVNVFIVITLLAVVASNLPRQSSLGALAAKAFGPYLLATGLGQRWNVFAADPLPYTVYVSARVRYADGSSASWSYPFGGRVVGAYRFYRWEKLSWRVNTDSADADLLREQLALWAAREIADEKRNPVAIELVRRFADTPVPGSNEKRIWREIVFYRLPLPTAYPANG